jgi:hypothetical protein
MAEIENPNDPIETDESDDEADGLPAIEISEANATARVAKAGSTGIHPARNAQGTDQAKS